jgi:putative Holliday junction resolvase
VAFDLGERRIGVAVSDSAGILASPYGVIERSGDRDADRRQMAATAEETRAEIVVVGLPLSLSGSEGKAATAARTESEALAGLLEIPVVTFDERLTTVEAARRRKARAVHRAPGTRASRSRKSIGRVGIDAEAAAVLLEAWLETARS